MNIDTSIASFLIAYEVPAIFLGAFFLGETVVLTASYLAATGLWSIYEVFIYSLLGTIISDALWFLLGQKVLMRIHKWEKFWQRNEKLLIRLDYIFGKRSFLILLYFKFLYGTRIFTIVYLSMRAMKLRTFLLYDTIGTIIWLIVIMIGGWLVGKGATQLSPYVSKLEYGIIIIALLIIGYKLLTAWIGKKVIEK